ncbi:inorganic pyrophosphatase [Siphonobacter aquaeclarae]|jgi:inorganic pyrophosphatase|uniref:inorganic diphosphatase n=1 Tax=Siphonobacter aquaeclarae TaxID=563176 RepID=A0A1G9PI30_9BACT|nr:inorganic pyrophosphatase [Siphonobacter aquaeclarae]MBO9639747.1 inorganic pyrophosphatase [Siphonobacter aquaeclarae]SDL98496.1 inorganic pyrophosphatase [Siphonobacter aquaeclarae]
MRYSMQIAHPWHGVPIGENAPEAVTAFIEIVPTDTVKYEIDKETGFLKIDRPQLFSNAMPSLYGFIPQTYCGEEIARYATEQSGRDIPEGDGDPLDICVLTEKEIPHGNIILQAIPIGGIRLIDKGEADDKIIAVLKNDALYGNWKDIADCPKSVLNRLVHYFLTYKNIPGEEKAVIEIESVYGRDIAHEVIRKSRQDYRSLTAVPTI